MRVELRDDPAAFLQEVEPLLLADEARHNLMLGLAGTLRDEPALYPDFRLYAVLDGGELVGAALRTLPYTLVLARPRDPGALQARAEAIDEELPGVVGATPEAEQFAEAWSARTGVRPETVFEQGIYALTQVIPVRPAAGAMRTAGAADRPLVVDWWQAFAVEALGEAQEPERVARGVDSRLAGGRGGIALWEDGAPVSLGGWGSPTPNGIRVGPVYTPPELRGRGYASALVAALSAQLLAEGHRFCFLYTDMANPTSNRIYREVGYELVCGSAEVAFRPRH